MQSSLGLPHFETLLGPRIGQMGSPRRGNHMAPTRGDNKAALGRSSRRLGATDDTQQLVSCPRLPGCIPQATLDAELPRALPTDTSWNRFRVWPRLNCIVLELASLD